MFRWVIIPLMKGGRGMFQYAFHVEQVDIFPKTQILHSNPLAFRGYAVSEGVIEDITPL